MTARALDPTLLSIFENELGESMAEIQSHLLRIEKGDDESGELLEDILRLAHDLKGSARVVGLDAAGHLAHATESLLMGWRGRDEVARDDVELVLRSCDLLAELTAHPGDEAIEERCNGLVERLAAGGSSVAAKAVAAASGGAPVTSPKHAAAPDTAPDTGPDAAPHAPPTTRSTGAETLRVPRGRVEDVVDGSVDLLAGLDALGSHLSRLDAAMRQFTRVSIPKDADGEIAASRNALRKAIQGLSPSVRQLQERSRALVDESRELAMVPIAPLVVHLERVARDAARVLGREVRLEVVGGQLTMDVQLVEALKGPLTHMVRNAVDHGLETPDERAAAGKSTEGRLQLAFRLEGDRLRIGVCDDGRGVDVETVRRKLGERAEDLDDAQLLHALLVAGISTRDVATEFSGRGIGMGAVAATVERLRGVVRIESTPGAGTEIEIDLPANVSLLRGLVVRVGDVVAVLPQSGLAGIAPVGPDTIPLASILEQQSASTPTDAVLLRGRQGEVAVSVDEIGDVLEVVRRPLGEHLGRLRFVSGATILAQGEPAILLDPNEIAAACEGDEPVATPRGVGRRVLVVDDSPTMRARLRSDLEDAGCAVVTANDGVEALQLVESTPVDAVVSDVRMPGLDGFGVLAALADRFPVVLVTSFPESADEDRAYELGALAYFPKDPQVGRRVVSILKQILQLPTEVPT